MMTDAPPHYDAAGSEPETTSPPPVASTSVEGGSAKKRTEANKTKLARDSVAGSSSGTREGRSHKVQRATAPVTLRETSAAVRGSYLVDIGEHANDKDIAISTESGPIDVDLRMTSNVPRPIVINVQTSSGPMRVDVSQAHPRQVLHVACCNYKGPMCVILPNAFSGIIGTINSTGKIKLSDALLRRSVLMPWSGCEGGKLYQIEPAQLPAMPTSLRTTGSQTAEQLQVGNDRLDVETERGSITVLLASEQASTFGFVDKSPNQTMPCLAVILEYVPHKQLASLYNSSSHALCKEMRNLRKSLDAMHEFIEAGLKAGTPAAAVATDVWATFMNVGDDEEQE